MYTDEPLPDRGDWWQHMDSNAEEYMAQLDHAEMDRQRALFASELEKWGGERGRLTLLLNMWHVAFESNTYENWRVLRCYLLGMCEFAKGELFWELATLFDIVIREGSNHGK